MPETNKQLVRKWFDEVWNKQNREVIAEMLDSDAVLHEGPGEVRGSHGFYAYYDRMRDSFSDFKLTVHDVVSEGDTVCARWSCTMRHTGPGFGLPATDKELSTTGISIITFANGRIVAGWQNWDMLGLVQQINGDTATPSRSAAVAAG